MIGSGVSAEPLATSSPGVPSSRSSRTAWNAGWSPRSSPQKSTAAADRSAARSRRACPLSAPGGRSSSTSLPGSTASPVRPASSASGPRSRSSSACGCAAAASVHRQRLALVLDPGARVRAGGRQHRRQVSADYSQPWRCGRAGEPTPFPSLHPVVTKDDHLRDRGNPSKRGSVGSRPAGSDRDRASKPGELMQRLDRGRSGPGLCRVGHDRRERAVKVQRDKGTRRVSKQRGEAARPAAVRGSGTPGATSGVSPRVTMSSVSPSAVSGAAQSGQAERIRCRLLRCRRSLATRTGSNSAASGLSMSWLSSW